MSFIFDELSDSLDKKCSSSSWLTLDFLFSSPNSVNPFKIISSSSFFNVR